MGCSLLTWITLIGSAINVQAEGWQEVAATKVFDEIGPSMPGSPIETLDDAREVVHYFFAPGDLIAGGKAMQAIKLPSRQVLHMNDRTFQVTFADGKIATVEPLFVAEIKVFPDQTYKVALKGETPGSEPIILDNHEAMFIVEGYWPVVGQNVWYYNDAYARAKQMLRNAQQQ